MMARMNSQESFTFGKPGQIQVIFGPMFSGKTTELLRRIKRFEVARYTCLLIKYSKDDRYDQDGVATHDRQITKATSAETLSNLTEMTKDYDVIGIDEGQFFPDCVEFAENMANLGKIVVVAALDATFQRKGFGNILNLVPIAESVVKLNAVCMLCYQEASYTKRMGTETKVEIIGGADKYMAVCRDCYHKPSLTSLSPEINGNPQHTPTIEGAVHLAKVHGRTLFPSPNNNLE